jgi:hypothetical protein
MVEAAVGEGAAQPSTPVSMPVRDLFSGEEHHEPTYRIYADRHDAFGLGDCRITSG